MAGQKYERMDMLKRINSQSIYKISLFGTDFSLISLWSDSNFVIGKNFGGELDLQPGEGVDGRNCQVFSSNPARNRKNS